ncbi:hypothetical protein LZC95_25535 [Pendulispora brunnea]|uniref:Peptidase M48 domain-containing protein n=1 Tax=Pendulispora brunnea TaxID=2905690 RepID=A0ABZ2KS82_9BACT
MAITAPMLMFAIGCSASNDGGESADLRPPPAVNQALCEPLHRPLPTPNANAYRFFASDQEAVEHAKVLFPTISKKPPLPAGHALQAQAEALISELYPTFRKVYPTETQGLDKPPRALIIEDDEVNAFATKDSRVQPEVYPWYVAFNTGAFNGATRDDLLGLVGHELGHLLLRNYSAAVKNSYQRHYIVSGDEQGVFGAYQTDDKKVAKRAAELDHLRARVGMVGVPEVGRIPQWPFHPKNRPPFYDDVVTYAFNKYKPQSADPSACTEVQTKSLEVKQLLLQRWNPDEYTLSLDDGTKAAIASKIEPLREALRKCLPVIKRTFTSLIQEKYGKLPGALDADESAAESKYAGKDFVAEILELNELKHKALAELEAKTDLPLESLRVYEEEEDADVISARVLREHGKDPRSVSLYLLHNHSSDESASQCFAQIREGSVPFFGALRDNHPTTCWRHWNLDRFARTLDVSCK